jgi:hypothetical protein
MRKPAKQLAGFLFSAAIYQREQSLYMVDSPPRNSEADLPVGSLTHL